MSTEYENDEQEERPKRKWKKKAFMYTRSPGSLEQIRVYDDEDPDEKIAEFIAQGKDWWLEANDPERAQKIREEYLARQNDKSKKPQKKGKKQRVS